MVGGDWWVEIGGWRMVGLMSDVLYLTKGECHHKCLSVRPTDILKRLKSKPRIELLFCEKILTQKQI